MPSGAKSALAAASSPRATRAKKRSTSATGEVCVAVLMGIS